MDFIRKKVSGNKNRYTDDDYNLDLSYITPKVIAMAFPGEGLRKLYRNSIDSVRDFLNAKHKDKYMIINISGEKYSYDLFDNKVIEFDWIDHQAPQISTLFSIIKEMFIYCSSDPENIVAVNCRAGKGRTGTVICCFMLFSGMFKTPHEALEYYSLKRFKSGEGVTQPSQKRYVFFFFEILQRKIFYPLHIYLKGVFLTNVPRVDINESFKPYFNLFLENNDTIVYTNKKSHSEQRKIFAFKNNSVLISEEDFSFPIVGDFTLSVYENNMIQKDELVGRISYNTAFMKPEGGVLSFDLERIDPDNLIKRKDYEKDFKISVRKNI